MAAPNIVSTTTITGKTDVLAVTTTPTDIVANALSSNKVYKVNNLYVSNINGTASATITASLYRGGTEYKIAHIITVPPAATLQIIDRTGSVYLEEGDSIRLTASANSYLHAVSSYEVIS